MKPPIAALAAAAALLAVPGANAFTVAPLPPATAHIVNVGPGNQTDPHVSGSLVSYTSEVGGTTNTEIRYHDLAAASDSVIPGGAGMDFLSDVSGSTIAFTRVTADESAIWAYDTVTGTGAEVAPEVTSNRHAPAVGGRTVAFQDFSFSSSPLEPEVVAASLDGGPAVRLTTNNRQEREVAVSPDGAAIVWLDCNTSGADCDVWSARRTASVWTTANVTASAGEEGAPETNGSLVVYHSFDHFGATDWDVQWRPVGGGAETRLPLPGLQSNLNISGNVIAFDSSATTGGARDVYLYELASDALYQITSTPDDESLSDVSVSPTGFVRVVYQVREAGNFNIRDYSFQLPGRTPSALIADLIALVESFNLRQGIENSLDAKLENASKALERMNAGDQATACSLLGAFINEVNAQSGKALTTDQASQLVAAANAVKAALGCGP